MKTISSRFLYILWGICYVFCVGMGTLTERSTLLSVLLTILSVMFFVPPGLLLAQAYTAKDSKQLKTVRWISLSSLVLTLSLVVVNILTVTAGEQVGRFLNDLLILVSAPMFCCYLRFIPIFLWACLFVSSFPRIWKK